MFEDIIGNDHIKKYLKKLVLNKTFPNTSLFLGKDGIGKKVFAKALASYLMYENPSSNNLNKVEKETHPDCNIFSPEGKIYMHSISSMKELIKKVFFFPFEASKKVFIIEDAHRMTKEASNALLKTLEEPNLDSFIILITSEKEKIIPTILSRCLLVKFSDISKEEMETLLTKWGKTKEEAKKIETLSQGSIKKACDFASFVNLDEKTDLLLKMISSKKNFYKCLNELDTHFKSLKKEPSSSKYFKEVEFFLFQILMWYRDLHILDKKLPSKFIFFSDKIPLLERRVAFKKIPPLEKIDFLIQEVKEAVNLNFNFKSSIQNLFFKLENL